MTNRELSQLLDLQQEAYIAGLYQKSARIARQGAELATERHDHFWRVRFRFWEGDSLVQAGEREAATPVLLEAAQPEPEADPADTYNAITTLIDIAIQDRPAAFARRLLQQGRDHLERSGKFAWRHMLDLLEGELASARGDWDEALDCYRSGYESREQHPGYPGFTTAGHLIRLVETGFRRRDNHALLHWRRVLDDCHKESEHDHLLAEQARLLCHRAGLLGVGAEIAGDAVTAARGLLRRLEGYEGGGTADYALEALRVLMLYRHWPPVEDWSARSDIGDHWLFGGDLQLARARESLGLPARDEDWCTLFERPDPATLTESQRTQAREHLAAARKHYESQLQWAAKVDLRLETDWYTRTLRTRLQRVTDLTP